MKILSREATRQALLEDGKNICSAPFEVRDNAEFAWLAIENGASINDVSYRLQNDSDFLMKYARYCSQIGIIEQDFFRATFCAIQSVDLVKTYSSYFAQRIDFALTLKRKLGNKYQSPIRELNSKNANPDDIVSEYWQRQISKLRKEYYSSSYQEMCESRLGYSEASNLRTFALIARSENHPFSKIPLLIERQIKQLDREIDYFRSKTGKGSFPERVIDALLRQLNISFEREKVFQWSKPTQKNEKRGTKRYDFYIQEKNAIIEVHGAQHFFGGFEALGGRTLEEEQSNDKLKQELAQKNGITHYVVIDASFSNLSYIKDSVISNDCLSSLFDISHIDWDKVKTKALGEITNDKNCSFAVYDFKKEFLIDLCNFFRSEIKDGDTLPPKKAFGEGCQEETKELSAWKRKLKKSKNGLYPHEIIILSRAQRRSAPEMSYPINADKAIGKWYYEYGISNIRPIVERLHKNGFLKVEDSIHALSCMPKEKLIKFASKRGINCKGKKDELIKRIIDSASLDEISLSFPPSRYELTELGKTELEENLYLFDTIEIEAKSTGTKSIHLTPKSDIKNVIKEHDGKLKHKTSETSQLPQKTQQDFAEFEEDSEYQILCALDNSTCEKCGSMDLKVFKYSEAKIGINYPPFHDGCRCCVVSYFENSTKFRAARDRDGKSIQIPKMDWKQWKAIYGRKTRATQYSVNHSETSSKLRNNSRYEKPNDIREKKPKQLPTIEKEGKKAIPPFKPTTRPNISPAINKPRSQSISKEKTVHPCSKHNCAGCFCWILAIHLPFPFLFSKNKHLKTFARIWSVWIGIVILVTQCAAEN